MSAPSAANKARGHLRKSVARYELAIGLTGVALAARFLLASQLQGQPLLTFFLAVVLTAFVAGPGPTLTSFVLGYVAAEWFFIEPLHHFGPHSSRDFARLITYVVVCSVVTVGSTRISRARDRAEASRAELEREVAERHRIEEALRDADRRKDEFLGVLAHELRNPLSPIVTSLQVLQRAPPGSEQAERARSIIGRQVNHLTRLIDDLMDVKRISTGKFRLNKERMDLTQQVRETIEDLRPLFVHRSLSLDLKVPERSIWMEGDRTRLGQVLTNLLHNSAKFTDPGGHVAVRVENGEGDARIHVRDDGAGVAPEMLDKLFDAFVQSDRTLHRTKGGLGLGLSLVRAIAELHGGTVSVQSDGIGKGTEFVVTLPTTAAP